jgi:uncharacterized protein YwgA
MDRGQIALKLSLESLGLEFRIDTFENRLILQKTVYLAQAAGVHLGYYYQWYLHGPYSPSLTKDAYAMSLELDSGMGDSTGWKLEEQSKQLLVRLRDIFASPKDKARRLELLASVHFLIDYRQTPATDIKKICEILTRFNKNFTEAEIQQAIEHLREYGLLKN